MAHYESMYVVCPFYRRNDTTNSVHRICCEGVDTSNTLNLVFASQAKMHEYVVRYCNSVENHKRCMICQMLTKKWEEQNS